MITRRAILKDSAFLSLAPLVPGFLARTATAAEPDRDGHVLVVLQLDGGNDGINTVVPFGDEHYKKCRRELACRPTSCARSAMESACTRR